MGVADVVSGVLLEADVWARPSRVRPSVTGSTCLASISAVQYRAIRSSGVVAEIRPP